MTMSLIIEEKGLAGIRYQLSHNDMGDSLKKTFDLDGDRRHLGISSKELSDILDKELGLDGKVGQKARKLSRKQPRKRVPEVRQEERKIEGPPRFGRKVVQIEKVGRQFGSEPVVHALVDVGLELSAGEWLAITGPSGAGKSTLLNVIGCLDRPTTGRYLFDGIDTTSLSDKQRAGLRSRRIGFVFQSFHLLPHRSLLENVMLAEVYRKQSHRGRRERALEAIDQVGLRDRADFLPTKLSGGERQRVAIARALVGSPSLLLCDEPTGNLDSKSTASILDLFESLNAKGLTLIVVTHEENVARRAGRQVHIIDGVLHNGSFGSVPEKRVQHKQTIQVNPKTRWEPKPPIAGMVAMRNRVSAGKAWMPQPGVFDKHNTESDTGAQKTRHKGFLGTDERIHSKAGISKSGITLRDLIDEAIAGMFARPGRMMLTVLGIVIGLTALVATLGLTRTANNRIISQFDQLAATEIRIMARPGPVGLDPDAIPWDAPARLLRLNGVVAAGNLSEVNIGEVLVSSSPIKDPMNQTAFNMSVQAASPGLFASVHAELQAGRYPDNGHSVRADRVAVLGPDAALQLGIVSLKHLPAIAIGDNLYLVIGIIKDVKRQPEILSSVIIPEGTARRDFGLRGPGSVIVETRIGAASLIAGQTPMALRPDNDLALRIEVPPEPRRVRDAVKGDLNVVFLMLGGLSLVVGAIGIGNITLVSVIERTGEIGLRRAIGATRGHIVAQFLLESAAMGLIGGIIGASIGILIVIAVSAFQVWTPVLDPEIPFLAPILGGTIGLVSGTYPALRAAHLEPVEAFRN